MQSLAINGCRRIPELEDRWTAAATRRLPSNRSATDPARRLLGRALPIGRFDGRRNTDEYSASEGLRTLDIRLSGQLESNAHKWLSPDSGAGGSVDGCRHTAFAVKSVSNRSSSSSARPCNRAIRRRRNTDEYSASRTLDIRYRRSPSSMASRIRAGGLFGSAPISPDTMTLVSTTKTCRFIGSVVPRAPARCTD